MTLQVPEGYDPATVAVLAGSLKTTINQISSTAGAYADRYLGFISEQLIYDLELAGYQIKRHDLPPPAKMAPHHHNLKAHLHVETR